MVRNLIKMRVHVLVVAPRVESCGSLRNTKNRCEMSHTSHSCLCGQCGDQSHSRAAFRHRVSSADRGGNSPTYKKGRGRPQNRPIINSNTRQNKRHTHTHIQCLTPSSKRALPPQHTSRYPLPPSRTTTRAKPKPQSRPTKVPQATWRRKKYSSRLTGAASTYMPLR